MTVRSTSGLVFAMGTSPRSMRTGIANLSDALLNLVHLYSISLRNDVRQIIYENCPFDSLVWGSLRLAPITSLFGAYSLLGACMLTTYAHKHIRLLTRVYGSYKNCMTFLIQHILLWQYWHTFKARSLLLKKSSSEVVLTRKNLQNLACIRISSSKIISFSNLFHFICWSAFCKDFEH